MKVDNKLMRRGRRLSEFERKEVPPECPMKKNEICTRNTRFLKHLTSDFPALVSPEYSNSVRLVNTHCCCCVCLITKAFGFCLLWREAAGSGS
ncbi:hypothetical protein Pfo_019518 [Paulownia fortunei]|nr:hypothetical protein Pfo_019518 [Paulownia fortunei]